MEYFVNQVNDYVWQGVPNVLKGLIVAMVFVALFRRHIKARPALFYIYPALYCAWEIVSLFIFLSPDVLVAFGGWEAWFPMIGWQLDYLGLGTTFATGLITIVMFIGVLPQTPWVKALFEIRTEMSIIGGTILFGHGILQLDNIILYDKYGYADASVFFTLVMYCILGLVLLALLILPWLTSFPSVRRRMGAQAWKRLQTYTGVPLFVGMLLFGLAMYAGRALAYPGLDVGAWDAGAYTPEDVAYFESCLLAAKTYLVLLIAYIALRIRKTRKA